MYLVNLCPHVVLRFVRASVFTTPICGNNVIIEQNIAKKKQICYLLKKKLYILFLMLLSFISALTENRNGIKGMYY